MHTFKTEVDQLHKELGSKWHLQAHTTIWKTNTWTQEQRTLFSEKEFNLCDKAPTQDMVHVYRQTMLYK